MKNSEYDQEIPQSQTVMCAAFSHVRISGQL